MRRIFTICTAIAMILPTLATAEIVSVSDTVDDATLTLTADNAFIVGVTTDWCEVRIQVVGIEEPFTNGDVVTIWVYEDDVAGDDLLFQTTFTVTPTEVASQLVDRTFNCSADLSLVETDLNAEVYAEALVEKDQCGTFCVNDSPTTPNLTIAMIDYTDPPPPPPPGTITVSDTEDDATATLSAQSSFFAGLTVDWCEVRIQVLGNDVPISTGDQITVEVYEDDVVGDDLLFQTTFTVTLLEAANQLVDRTFNCSADLSLVESDFVAEVYATALVVKDQCGFTCVNDNPTTGTIAVAIIEPVPVQSTTWGAVKVRYGVEGTTD